MSVDVPPEADEWEFEAKRFAISEANTAVEIREEIDGIVGLGGHWDRDQAATFTKDELAMLLLALGGPQEVDA